MQFEPREAVLQRVVLKQDVPRQLAGFAHGQDPEAGERSGGGGEQTPLDSSPAIKVASGAAAGQGHGDVP